jgi:hypothetical protein
MPEVASMPDAVASEKVVGVVEEPVAVTRAVVVEKPAVVAKTVPAKTIVATKPATGLVPAAPAKPEEFWPDKHDKKHHGRGGRAGVKATVATERALLDDVARYRSALVATIDELHTRLSPKYQVDQLKSSLAQAGTDALSILKNEGGPVDETRKKKAETILKGGGALAGLVGLHSLRKLAKRAKLRRNMRRAISKGMPQEHVELVGVIEGLNPEGITFEDADSIIFNTAE